MNILKKLTAQVMASWGKKTLADFRRESEQHPEGGVFESIREPGGRIALIILCVTDPNQIAQLEKDFSFVDDGNVEDWNTLTLLDLMMRPPMDRPAFECLRDAQGRRSALVLIAKDPRSITIVESFFGLKS